MNQSIKEFTEYHWKYYRNLEEEFIQSLNYVHLHDSNFNVFSNQYVKQLQSICSEIDTLMKYFCELIDSTNTMITTRDRNKNIGLYKRIIDVELEDSFKNSKIFVGSLHIQEIEPWKEWDREPPKWWRDYNKVKHSRISSGSDENFKKANLENTFYSLGALYVLCSYIYKELCRRASEPCLKLKAHSHLFEMKDWGYQGHDFMSGMMVVVEDESPNIP